MDELTRRARDLHFDSVVVDGHADTIMRVLDRGEDIARPSPAQIDLPKMRGGGVDAQFFAGWVEPRYVKTGTCAHRALQMIDALRRVKGLVMARSASEIRRARGPAGVACIEGGHAIENDLGVLRMFAALGVRYLTLTWNNSNDWADACAEPPRHGGLTKFGREVVREMNRCGIMVDLSHAHEKTFWAALAATRKPVMASHSCARALCDHRRNLYDEQLRAVAKNDGVVCVNFYSGFLSGAFREASSRVRKPEKGEVRKLRESDDRKIRRVHEKYDRREARLPRPPLSLLLDHIDHIAKIAGADHVGLGSDYDGVASVPAGVEDCSKLPAITRGLLERGWSAKDVRKLLGGNVLRVMEANEP